MALNRNRDRGIAVESRPGAQVFDAVLDLGHIAQAHRIAALGADDQIAEIARIGQLLVGLEDQRLPGPIQRANRGIDIGCTQSGAEFIQADIAGQQRVGLDADPHRIALGTVNNNLRDAIHGGQGGGDQVIRIVLQLLR